MTIAGFSIKRPVLTTMVMISMIFIGIISMLTIRTEQLPNMNIPVVTISTTWSGAVPEDVETQVTKKIEEVLPNVDGIEKISSTSAYGQSTIVVEFEYGVVANDKLTEVQREVSKLTNDLPDDANTPVLRKVDAGAGNLTLLIVCTGADKSEMYSFLDQYLKPQLERISGVGEISIFGSADKQLQIQVDSDKLAAYNLTPVELYELIRAANVNLALGSIKTGQKSIVARFMGEGTTVADYENMILSANGNTLRLSDVADIVLTTEDEERRGTSNGKESVIVAVEKSVDGSTISINKAALAALEKVKPNFPPGMESRIGLNTSTDITDSISSIANSAVLALIFATIVLLGFLKNIRSTLIVSTALPVSIIFTFAFLSFVGSTLNLICLMGLSIGVGMLTDNSVVVIDNIYRHMTELKSPVMEAAENGSAEVTASVIASSLTNMVVFIPILFINGISKEIFRDMCYAIIFSNIAALIVALTLIPMLSSRFLSEKANIDKEGKIITKARSTYMKLIHAAMDHRVMTMAITLGVFVFTMLVGTVGPLKRKIEFMPYQDEGRYSITAEVGNGLDMDKLISIQDEIEAIVKAEPHTKTFFGFTRSSQISINVDIGKKSDRSKGVKEIIDEVRTKVSKIPGLRISMTNDFATQSQTRTAQIDLIGSNLSELKEFGTMMLNDLSTNPLLTDLKSTVDPGSPEARIVLNRDKIKAYGLNVSSIGQNISYYILGGNRGNTVTVKTGVDEIDVLVRLPKNKRADINHLMNLNMKVGDNQFVKLSDIADIVMAEGTTEINKTDRVYSVSISANRGPGAEQQDLQNAMLESYRKLNPPPSISWKWGGSSENMAKSFRQLGAGLLISLFLIYALLASQFENFIYPVIIIGSIPLALIGVIWGLIFTGMNMGLMVFIGIIMLAGIVVNNAIVLIDFIVMLRARGYSRYDAIIETCRTRFRPILMTASTTILGMVPLSLGLGEGSEIYKGMGVSVLFGMIFSTLLTLVVIPIIYTCVEDFNKLAAKYTKEWTRKLFRRKAKEA